MTSRLKKQTLDGRVDSNEAAVKLNEVAKKIKQVTRLLMSKVSELSMHQANVLNLYQQKNEKVNKGICMDLAQNPLIDS